MSSLDDTLAAPPCTQSISQEQTTRTVKEILQLTQGGRASCTAIAYDSKSAYNVLARGLGIVFGRCRDPQIASWLLDPDAREKTLHGMVTNFLPGDLPLLEGEGLTCLPQLVFTQGLENPFTDKLIIIKITIIMIIITQGYF